MKQFFWTFLIPVLLGLSAASPVLAQEVDEAAVEDTTSGLRRSQAPKVFLDCGRCDFSFIRREITFVNYVRDPELADVHVFVTDQSTGSGGRTYTLTFAGRQSFAGLDYTLTYTSQQTDTGDEERQGLTSMLKIGLVPYVARTPLAGQVSVTFSDEVEFEPEVVQDPWNSWVFDVEGSGSFSKEATRSAYSVRTSLRAERVTEDWKIRTNLYGNYDERNFKTKEEQITSSSQSSGFSGSLIKSLTRHWSAGLFGNVYSSTYRNMQLGIGLTPAVEYSVFPYEESSRKEWVFVYRLGYDYVRYIERTIFDKLEEQLLEQSVQTNVRIRQPWGFVYAGVSGSHYFHDLSKNSLDFYSNVSLRLLKGLSLRFSGNFQIIHDQLYLAAGNISDEDLLLQRKQLATTYQLSGSVGLAYTFGSIYNNVVNTRL